MPNSTTCGQPTAAAACAGPGIDRDESRGAREQRHQARNRQIVRGVVHAGDSGGRDHSSFSRYSGPVPSSTIAMPGTSRAQMRITRRPALVRPVLVVDRKPAQSAAHGPLVACLDQDQAAPPRARASRSQSSRSARCASLTSQIRARSALVPAGVLASARRRIAGRHDLPRAGAIARSRARPGSSG